MLSFVLIQRNIIWHACNLFSILSLITFSSCHTRPAVPGVKASMIAQLDTNQYTQIQWKDTLINFGTVTEGDTVRMGFGFANTGNKLLFINEVKPGCGCTIASYPQEPLLPGRSGTIEALFTTDWHPGAQQKIIMVKANTKGKIFHKLIFFGDVLPKPKPKKA